MDDLERDLLLSPDFIPTVSLATRRDTDGREYLMKAYFKVLTVCDNITVYTERIHPKKTATDFA